MMKMGTCGHLKNEEQQLSIMGWLIFLLQLRSVWGGQERKHLADDVTAARAKFTREMTT